MLSVRAYTPLRRWNPQSKRGWILSVLAGRLYPATQPFCLLLVRRVSDHDSDRLLTLNFVSFLSRSRNWGKNARYPFLVVVWIAQRIRDEHSYWHFGWCLCQVKNFGSNTQLCYGERAHLHFKCNQSVERCLNRTINGPFSFIAANS